MKKTREPERFERRIFGDTEGRVVHMHIDVETQAKTYRGIKNVMSPAGPAQIGFRIDATSPLQALKRYDTEFEKRKEEEARKIVVVSEKTSMQ